MIYLIDDKKTRQENRSWKSSKLKEYESQVTAIYSHKEIEEIRESIFQPGNLILFHDSFFDALGNKSSNLSDNFRNKLTNYVAKNNIYLVYFSGSIGARKILGNIAYCPVSALYNNLEFYLEYLKKNEEHDLKRLLFGETYFLEEVLILKKEIWNLLYDETQKETVSISPKLGAILDQLGNKLTYNFKREFADFEHMKLIINQRLDEKLFYS
jgi:signal peptidase I